MKNLTSKKSKNISGDQIYLKRISMRMSQAELSARMQRYGVNIGQEGVSKIETGARFVTDVELLTLAKIFGVSMEWLVRGDNDETPPR